MADETKPDVSDISVVTYPEIYIDGFVIGMSLSDMSILTMRSGQPQCKLQLSFNTAKSLATQLSAAIDTLEQRTNSKILTMDKIKQAFEKSEKE